MSDCKFILKNGERVTVDRVDGDVHIQSTSGSVTLKKGSGQLTLSILGLLDAAGEITEVEEESDG